MSNRDYYRLYQHYVNQAEAIQLQLADRSIKLASDTRAMLYRSHARLMTLAGMAWFRIRRRQDMGIDVTRPYLEV